MNISSTSLSATSKNHQIHLYEIYSSDIADLSSSFFLLSSVVPHSFFPFTLDIDVGPISQRLGYNVWIKSLSCIVFLNENVIFKGSTNFNLSSKLCRRPRQCRSGESSCPHISPGPAVYYKNLGVMVSRLSCGFVYFAEEACSLVQR